MALCNSRRKVWNNGILNQNFPSGDGLWAYVLIWSLSPPAESREWAASNVRIKKQQNSLMTGRPASRTTRGTAMGPTPRHSITPASGSPPSPTTTTSTAAPHRGWLCSEGSTRLRSPGHFGPEAEQVGLERVFRITVWMHVMWVKCTTLMIDRLFCSDGFRYLQHYFHSWQWKAANPYIQGDGSGRCLIFLLEKLLKWLIVYQK